MSDFGNSNYDYRSQEDPFRHDSQLDPNARPLGAAWGWIAAAIVLVVVLAAAFGYGHRPGQLGTKTAANDATPPAVTHMVPPATIPPPSTAPAAGTPTPPVTAAPNSPAQPGANR